MPSFNIPESDGQAALTLIQHGGISTRGSYNFRDFIRGAKNNLYAMRRLGVKQNRYSPKRS